MRHSCATTPDASPDWRRTGPVVCNLRELDRLREADLPEPRPAARCFISYSRRSSEDSALANELRAGLTAAGHEVFIDVGMRVGTDWVAEIEQRLDWCDALIVLLSEASIHSEMVLGEVRMAHHKRRRDGRPHILPIRVRYDGPLDYELESYLARIQYLPWKGPADTARGLDEILTALAPGKEPEREPPLGPSPVDLDPRRPQPSEDVRPLFPPPGGTIKLRDDFYVRRPSDNLVDGIAVREGETLAIKAPRQFGKSSLLVRYLARCGSPQEGPQRSGSPWSTSKASPTRNWQTTQPSSLALGSRSCAAFASTLRRCRRSIPRRSSPISSKTRSFRRLRRR